MGKVEAQTLRPHIRASLVHVFAENLTQGRMQDMRSGMIARHVKATNGIDACQDGVALRKSGAGLCFMDGQTLFGCNGVDNLELGISENQGAGVSNLAAHFGVEGRCVEDNLDVRAVRLNGAHALAVLDQGQNLGFGFQLFVADELGLPKLFKKLGVDTAVGAPSGLGVALVGGTCSVALLLHALGKALFIDANATFFADFLGYLDGEAIGVVQDECLITGKNGAVEFVQSLFKVYLSLAKRGAEALLFREDDTQDKLFV